MSGSLVVEFTKMEGAGNDFLVIDNRWYRFSDEELSDLAARWCPRRTGVGADGLLAYNPVDEAERASGLDFRMRYVNADGSFATMCANGARCLTRFALDSGLEGPEVAFKTDAGVYRARAKAAPDDDAPQDDAPEDNVRLYVPPARNVQVEVALGNPLPGSLDTVHSVSTGTPHLVVFVPDAESLSDEEVETWGRALRSDPAVQPEGANANFASVATPPDGPPFLTVRTYEKGVEAETLSCGTGVLAAATLAQATGAAEAQPIRIVTRGGPFRVGTETTDRGDERYLEGPVSTVFRGTLRL